jgi:hypothetical protein
MTHATGAAGTAHRRHGLRVAVARRLARAHPAGIMHGAVVMGAVFALIAHEGSTARVGAGATAVLVVYWLTHAYTDALGHGLHGEQVHLARRLVRFGRRDAAIALGGLPAVVTFGLALLLGAGIAQAVSVVLWMTLVLLTAVGYLAAHVAGITGWRLVGETLFATLLGACMVMLNTFLH